MIMKMVRLVPLLAALPAWPLSAGVPMAVSSAAPARTNAAAAPTAPSPSDVLLFANGDTLRGTFLGLEPEQGVRWRHDTIKETLTVQPSGIRSIRLEKARPSQPGTHNCRVFLNNGDRLVGTMAGLDGSSLTLQTWYAGTLNLPRNGLRTVATIFKPAEIVYEGPTGLEGWTLTGNGGGQVFFQNGGGFVGGFGGVVKIEMAGGDGAAPRPETQPTAWQYQDGAFQASAYGIVGRKFKLPTVSNIEFDLQCQGYPQLGVQFYSDALDKQYGCNAYFIQFSGRSAQLIRKTPSSGDRAFGSGQTPFTGASPTKTHVALRTDRAQKTVALFLDDVLIGKWTDSAELGGEGTGVMFIQQGNVQTRISNLLITDWDGHLDESDASAVRSKEDSMTLKNQDKLTGQLLGIKEGKVEFKTAFTTVSVPLERVSSVGLAQADGPTPAPAPAAARLTFKEFGKLTIKLASWNDQSVEGTSPVFGPAKLNPAAFKLIEFNLQ
jgi:hypothetical protein